MVMRRIVKGVRPSRPQKGKKLGLSDELWKLIQSSLVHEAERRPPVSTFVDYLEKATPEIAVLKELVEFDASSEEHIQKLRHMFEYENNTLLGMREEETLAVIEVFDQASLFVHYLFAPLERLWFRRVPGSQLFVGRLEAPQPMFAWAPGGLCPMWPFAEELLDRPQ